MKNFFILYKFFKTSTFPLLNYWYEKIFSAKCFAIFFFSFSSWCYCCFFRGENRKQQQQNARQFFYSHPFAILLRWRRRWWWCAMQKNWIGFAVGQIVCPACVYWCCCCCYCAQQFFFLCFQWRRFFYCRVICMMRFRCLHIKWMEMMNFLSFSDEGLLGMFWGFFMQEVFEEEIEKQSLCWGIFSNFLKGLN